MKPIKFILFILILFPFSCEREPVDSYVYDSLLFKRTGAGNIEFKVFPAKIADQVIAVINKYSFKDTLINLILTKSTENSLTFSSFKDAMEDKVVLSGDFKQPTGMTGTWTYVYLVKDNVETEVTNTDLRANLVGFEQMVRAKIN